MSYNINVPYYYIPDASLANVFYCYYVGGQVYLPTAAGAPPYLRSIVLTNMSGSNVFLYDVLGYLNYTLLPNQTVTANANGYNWRMITVSFNSNVGLNNANNSTIQNLLTPV